MNDFVLLVWWELYRMGLSHSRVTMGWDRKVFHGQAWQVTLKRYGFQKISRKDLCPFCFREAPFSYYIISRATM